jgi:hypothetical protein
MPGFTFSFHLPRFLRPHRSPRSHSSPANSRNDSHPPHLSPTPAVSPLLSSWQDARKQDIHTDAGTSYSFNPSTLTHLHHSPDRLSVGTAWGDSTGQPPPMLPPITSILRPESISPDLVARPPVCFPPLPDPTNSTQDLYPSCSLATSLQQSLVIERQSVSLPFKFHLPMTMLNHSKPPSAKDLTSSWSQHRNQEVFKNARDFSVVGSNFIDNTNARSKLC